MHLVATRWQHTHGVWFCRRRRHQDERGRSVAAVARELFKRLQEFLNWLSHHRLLWDFDRGMQLLAMQLNALSV